jgi:hypothetical protein
LLRAFNGEFVSLHDLVCAEEAQFIRVAFEYGIGYGQQERIRIGQYEQMELIPD